MKICKTDLHRDLKGRPSEQGNCCILVLFLQKKKKKQLRTFWEDSKTALVLECVPKHCIWGNSAKYQLVGQTVVRRASGSQWIFQLKTKQNKIKST